VSNIADTQPQLSYRNRELWLDFTATRAVRNGTSPRSEEANMLWTIFVVLLVLWLLGFSLHVAGGLIHLLLVIALVVLVINLLSGRSSAI